MVTKIISFIAGFQVLALHNIERSTTIQESFGRYLLNIEYDQVINLVRKDTLVSSETSKDLKDHRKNCGR